MSANDAEDRAWLERIMADPKNLGLRMQFARWLKGRGHDFLPELIYLQCSASKLLDKDGNISDNDPQKPQYDFLTQSAGELLGRRGQEILSYFGIVQPASMNGPVAKFDDYPLSTLLFSNGLPTSVIVNRSDSMAKVPAILKKLLVTKMDRMFVAGSTWEGVSEFTALEELHAHHCTIFDGMPTLDSLTYLRIYNKCPDFTSYAMIAPHPKLERLEVVNFEIKKAPDTLDGMHNYTELKALHIDPSTRLKGIPVLPKLEELQYRFPSVKNLEPLEKRRKLKTLIAYHSFADGTLHGLKDICPNLQTLNVSGSSKLKNISELVSFTKLQSLYLDGTAIDADQLDYIPDSVTTLHVPHQLVSSVLDIHGFGLLPDLQSLNGQSLYDFQASPTPPPSTAPDEPPQQEEQSFAAEIEHLADVSERLKKFKRPSDLGRSR